MNSTIQSCLLALDGARKSFRLLKAEREIKENVLTGQALSKTIRPSTLAGLPLSISLCIMLQKESHIDWFLFLLHEQNVLFCYPTLVHSSPKRGLGRK